MKQTRQAKEQTVTAVIITEPPPPSKEQIPEALKQNQESRRWIGGGPEGPGRGPGDRGGTESQGGFIQLARAQN